MFLRDLLLTMDPQLKQMGLASMKDYVTGETSLSIVVAKLHRIPLPAAQDILRENREELDALNPARSVILESIVGA